jgi:chromosome segregation ATPase
MSWRPWSPSVNTETERLRQACEQLKRERAQLHQSLYTCQAEYQRLQHTHTELFRAHEHLQRIANDLAQNLERATLQSKQASQEIEHLKSIEGDAWEYVKALKADNDALTLENDDLRKQIEENQKVQQNSHATTRHTSPSTPRMLCAAVESPTRGSTHRGRRRRRSG